jgi:hypothetical protein
MEIRPVGAELFNTDRQTDRRYKANSLFSAILRTRLKKAFNISKISETTKKIKASDTRMILELQRTVRRDIFLQ